MWGDFWGRFQGFERLKSTDRTMVGCSKRVLETLRFMDKSPRVVIPTPISHNVLYITTFCINRKSYYVYKGDFWGKFHHIE